MVKILVVEDDPIINQVICEFLKDSGYTIATCYDGETAVNLFQTEAFDLIILDIMIPKLSGLEVLQHIRKVSDVPIMMLTAVEDEATQLFSFNQKISDYIVKPFSPLILMKRIENILNHYQVNPTKIISIGAITIEVETGNVFESGELISLTRKEYDILLFLVKNIEKVVARETIMMAIWGYSELDSRVLDNHIKNIRKKLPTLNLITVVGRGYKITEVFDEHH